MAKFRIFLYKLYKSDILFLMGLFMYGFLNHIIFASISCILLISHISLGMYFKRKELQPYQYGIRIGLITGIIGTLIMRIAVTIKGL